MCTLFTRWSFPLENPLSSAEVSGASEICLPRPLFLISASTCRFGIITVDFSVYVSTRVPECMCQYEINGMGILAGLRRGGEHHTVCTSHSSECEPDGTKESFTTLPPPLSSLPSLILNCLNDQERKLNYGPTPELPPSSFLSNSADVSSPPCERGLCVHTQSHFHTGNSSL